MSVQEHQGSFVVSPSDDILIECQGLFGSGISDFTPQEVFIGIQMLSKTNDHYRNERDFLQRIMQTRLCAPGVYHTDEGRFIRLSIAFSRVISLLGAQQLCPSISKNEGHLVDIRGVCPGIWEVKVRFLSPEYVVSVRGSLEDLTKHILYKEPTFPPSPHHQNA